MLFRSINTSFCVPIGSLLTKLNNYFDNSIDSNMFFSFSKCHCLFNLMQTLHTHKGSFFGLDSDFSSYLESSFGIHKEQPVLPTAFSCSVQRCAFAGCFPVLHPHHHRSFDLRYHPELTRYLLRRCLRHYLVSNDNI